MTMRRITDIQELRGVQLGILDDIHAFCVDNGIRYFLACGTLIGAVRHKGYIPWDDDIDLYMPRDDYERFINEFKSVSGNCRVLDPKKEKHYYYTYAKVVDKRTLLVEPEADGYRIGVYVDVFPVDYVTDNMAARRRPPGTGVPVLLQVSGLSLLLFGPHFQPPALHKIKHTRRGSSAPGVFHAYRSKTAAYSSFLERPVCSATSRTACARFCTLP